MFTRFACSSLVLFRGLINSLSLAYNDQSAVLSASNRTAIFTPMSNCWCSVFIASSQKIHCLLYTMFSSTRVRGWLNGVITTAEMNA